MTPSDSRSIHFARLAAFALLVALLASCAVAPGSPETDLPELPTGTEDAVSRDDLAENNEADLAPEPELVPTNPDVIFHILAAESAGRAGDIQPALEHYLEAAILSNDVAIAARATRLAFQAGAWEQAVLAADRWTYLVPNDLDALEASVVSRLQVQDNFGATRDLNRVFDLYEDEPQVGWARVAGLISRSPRPDQALAVLTDFIESRGLTEDADGYLAQSQLVARLGDRQLAEELANQAVARAPDRVDLRQWAGSLAASSGNTVGALVHFAVAYSAEPENRDVALAYAELLHRDGNHESALDILGKLERLPDIQFTQVVYATEAEYPELAEQVYQEMTDSNPEAVDHALYTAQAAEMVGRTEEAAGWYAKVPKGPRWLNAVVRQAYLTVEFAELSDARSVLTVLKNSPLADEAEQGYLSDAILLQQEGYEPRAVQSLTQGLSLLKESTMLRYNRALMYANLNRAEDAEADLRLLLEQNPENPDALNALGYTLTDLTDRHLEARDYIEKALRLKPNDPAIVDSMGWVLFRLGELDEARKFLEQALKMANNAEIAAHLADVLWALGLEDDARGVLAQAVELDPDNRVLKETLERLGVDV